MGEAHLAHWPEHIRRRRLHVAQVSHLLLQVVQARVLHIVNVEGCDSSRLRLGVLHRPFVLRTALAVLSLLHLSPLKIVHFESPPVFQRSSLHAGLWAERRGSSAELCASVA